MTAQTHASAEGYVRALDLPAAGPTFEAVAAVSFSSRPEAVAIGSQLVEFASGVGPETRTAIADGILLAQLAANKAVAQSGDVFRWYDKYVEVLQNIGWLLREVDFQSQTLSDSQAGMHKALIPVLTAMLGPHAAAASIVLQVLEGLDEMDPDSSWLTLFDRSSRQGQGAKFQVSHIDANAHGEPEVALACFSINAKRTITQVLFFKFTGEDASIKKASGRMAISADRLMAAKSAIADRVGPFVADYVAKLDI